MKTLLGRICCYQCNRYFFAFNPYCPRCGATRRETTSQASVRWVRILVLGVLVGGGLGFVTVLVARNMMTNPLALGLGPAPFPQGAWSMELFGSFIGGTTGAIVSAMMKFVKES